MAKKASREGEAAVFFRDEGIAVGLDAWVEKLNASSRYSAPWTRTTLAKAALRRVLDERAEKGEQP